MKGFEGQPKVPVSTDKVLFVQGDGPTAVIVIEFQIVVEEDLELFDLVLKVFDLCGIAAPWPFALDVEQTAIIDQLAEELGLDMLEEIDLILLRGKGLLSYLGLEPFDVPFHHNDS
tara:strand:- start:30710 stop:31057 length:348 start_codon:yes stop_codon:yes gene_type:complete